jgi:hypothetical protein
MDHRCVSAAREAMEGATGVDVEGPRVGIVGRFEAS